MSINPGTLNKRLTLQQPTRTIVSHEPIVAWTDKREVWGEILNATSSWAVNAKILYEDYTYRIRVRYWAEIEMDWRIKMGSGSSARYFNILGMENVGQKNAELILTVLEITQST